jgi:hypothetical protein
MAQKFNLTKILAPVDDIVRTLKNRRDDLMVEIDFLNGEIDRLSGRSRRQRRQTEEAADVKRKGKRKRRSREELNTLAQDVVSFIREKGKEGAAAKELQTMFGPLVPSVNAWLKTYAPVKVKTRGIKSKMRYFL